MAREKQLKTVDGVLSNDETKEEEACYSTFEGYVYQVRKNKNNKWVRSRGPYDDTTPASSAVTVEDDKEQWELICQNCWGLMKLIVRPLLNCPSAICKEVCIFYIVLKLNACHNNILYSSIARMFDAEMRLLFSPSK